METVSLIQEKEFLSNSYCHDCQEDLLEEFYGLLDETTDQATAVAKSNNDELRYFYATASPNYCKIVKSYIDMFGNVDRKDTQGRTLLYFAASTGNASLTAVLLVAGANANSSTNEKRTPLHEALANGHEEVARQLLCSGSDDSLADHKGITPFQVAITNNMVEALALMKAAALKNRRSGQNRPNEASNSGIMPKMIVDKLNQNDLSAILNDSDLPKNNSSIMSINIHSSPNKSLGSDTDLLTTGNLKPLTTTKIQLVDQRAVSQPSMSTKAGKSSPAVPSKPNLKEENKRTRGVLDFLDGVDLESDSQKECCIQ